MTKLDDYLRLFRLPNVFTAVADVCMGFLLVHQEFSPAASLLCLIGASALLYTSGMVWNDVFDAERDAKFRPERPIPSGRISRRSAAKWAFTLSLIGVGLAIAAGWVSEAKATAPWRPAAVGTMLVICILAYDGLLKTTVLGPVAMGACRFLNVLLGTSVGATFHADGAVAGFGPHQLIAAGGMGLYVVGVTWFARTEGTRSRGLPLSLATAVMMAGLGVLCLLHRNLPAAQRPMLAGEMYWMLLIGLLGFTILRRCGMAISDPRSAQVQLAVKHSIWSIIVLDAAIVLNVANWPYAVAVLLLLIPTVALGLRYPST